MQLSAHLRRLRTGHMHGASCTSLADFPPNCPALPHVAPTSHMEPEAIAADLMALGYLIQIRDGAQPAKDSRSCLRTLKHRFLVCVGFQVRTWNMALHG